MNINEYPLVVLQTELFDLPATADSTALQGNQNTAIAVINLLGVLTLMCSLVSSYSSLRLHFSSFVFSTKIFISRCTDTINGLETFKKQKASLPTLPKQIKKQTKKQQQNQTTTRRGKKCNNPPKPNCTGIQVTTRKATI